MSHNQTIDGEPRELIERAIAATMTARGPGSPTERELRALLDAADHVHEWDINDEGTATVCNCGARSSDEPCEQLATTPTRAALIRGREKLIDERDYWKTLAQKPVAQPQGEPVAVDVLSTGFYTTESGGGKYAINIGFRSMADMQAADAQLRELLKSR